MIKNRPNTVVILTAFSPTFISYDLTLQIRLKNSYKDTFDFLSLFFYFSLLVLADP